VDNELKKYENHVIICGLGATAMHIIENLESSRSKDMGDGFQTLRLNIGSREYLVIDQSAEAIEKILVKWPDLNCLIGDATDDDVLEKACINKAYGIFPVLSSEKDNLYITMAARQFNPRIRIVARTADVANIGKKLFKGGADSVISPNMLGGLRLVSDIARPHAADFLDELLHAANTHIQIEEILISTGSDLSGLTLKEAKLPEKIGLHIIAFKKRGEKSYTYNPSASYKIEQGDTVVVLGYWDQVDEIKKMAGGTG
jgi:voltage-gated potassium channel